MRTKKEIREWQGKHPGQILDLREANLRGADLRGADLRVANLHEANLRVADLRGADLRWANLRGADLRGADLRGADLRVADLRGANLRWANLREADLREANLRWADLRGADLRVANLEKTKLPHFKIAEGTLRVYGKKNGVIVVMEVPSDAKRTTSLVGRKCRAEYVDVIEVRCPEKMVVVNNVWSTTIYQEGNRVYPDSYDDDIRVECTHGIHFFLTLAETEEFN